MYCSKVTNLYGSLYVANNWQGVTRCSNKLYFRCLLLMRSSSCFHNKSTADPEPSIMSTAVYSASPFIIVALFLTVAIVTNCGPSVVEDGSFMLQLPLAISLQTVSSFVTCLTTGKKHRCMAI